MVSRSAAITDLTVTRAISAIVELLVFLVRKKSRQLYLLGDLDKEDEDSENKRVVQDADSADDNVDDLEWKQMTLSAKTRMCARWTCVSWSWSWSWSSCSHVSVVLHASHINDAFSIAAENSISCQPQQPVDCIFHYQQLMLYDSRSCALKRGFCHYATHCTALQFNRHLRTQ